MKYVCLIYEDPTRWPAPRIPTPSSSRTGTFTEQVKAAGKMIGGDSLEAVTTATTVRVRDGETLTTDGPFAETKEFLGGYYVLDCEVDLADNEVERAFLERRRQEVREWSGGAG